MAGELQKLNRGLHITRVREAGWNRLVDGIREVESKAGGRTGAGRGNSTFTPTTVITIKNATTTDQARGAILGVDDILFDPGTDAAQKSHFRSNFAFKGILPDAVGHVDSYCVLLDSIPKSKIGRAVIIGAAAITLTVNSADHWYARLINNDASKMTSAAAGVPVLWKQSGTGDKLAVIQLGFAVRVRECRVKQNGGSAGSSTTTCSYTYDVYGLDNTTKINTTGGPITPKNSRIANVIYAAATYGVFFIDADGSYALYIWNENPSETQCT